MTSSATKKQEVWSPLIHALQQHQSRLNEVLEAIERRDMTPSEVKGYLEWVVSGIKDLRRHIPIIQR